MRNQTGCTPESKVTADLVARGMRDTHVRRASNIEAQNRVQGPSFVVRVRRQTLGALRPALVVEPSVKPSALANPLGSVTVTVRLGC